MRFPRSIDDLTNDWLETQLECSIKGFRSEQIAVGVGLMGYLYRLHLDGEGPASIIAKFPVQDEVTRTHVAGPLGAYQAEVGYYRDAAESGPVSTARVDAAEVDDESGDFVLLLEDLADLRAEDQMAGCSPGDAELVLSQIAAHHAAHAVHGGPHPYAWLPNFDDPIRQQVIAGMAAQAAPPFLETFGRSLDGGVRDLVATLGEKVPQFMSMQDGSTWTMIHCDLRLDNVFFGGPDRPIVLLDWQLTTSGFAAYDVAYFLSQSMDTDVRRKHEKRLVEGYLTAMSDLGCPVDTDAFWIDFRRTLAFCIIYPVNVGGQMELANDRARELVMGMLDRSVAAIEDYDALGVWPAG